MGGSMCGRGHAWQEDMYVRECAWQGGMRGRRDGHCSRRYASYWNAFLFPMSLKDIFPVSQNFSLCFPVFFLSGKSKNQIPCFPYAMATLHCSEICPCDFYAVFGKKNCQIDLIG